MMKVKNYGLYAVLAVVMLMTALLISGCLEPIGRLFIQGAPEEENLPALPNNMRYVRFGFGDGRTLMPTAPDVADMYYDVLIGPTGSPTTNEEGIDYNELITLTVPLAIATHQVIINAYREYDGLGTDVIVATKTQNITVVDGLGTQTINIVLEPATGSGNGTFGWDLGIADIAELDFVGTIGIYDITDTTFSDPLGTGGTSGTEITLTSANATDDGFDLPAGTYRVRVSIGRGTAYKTIIITETFYIYKGLITTFEETFDAVGSMVYAITLDYNHATASLGGISGGTVNHGDTFTQPSLTPPSGEEKSGSALIGWTRDAAGTGTPAFTFGTTPVYRPYTFFAKWAANRDVGLTVTFDIDGSNVTPVITGNVTIDYDDIIPGGGQVTLSLNGSDFNATQTVWMIGGTSVTSPTLVINASNIGTIIGNSNQISVSCFHTTSDIQSQSATITVDIVYN